MWMQMVIVYNSFFGKKKKNNASEKNITITFHYIIFIKVPCRNRVLKLNDLIIKRIYFFLKWRL